MKINKIYQGDSLEVLKTFPSESVDCIVTSPPYYGLRDYGVEGQLGLERTLNEYLDKMLLITAELKRVLKKTGTMFWNHGDAYNTTPPGNSKESQIKKTFEGDGVYGRLMDRNRGKNFRFDQFKIRATTGVKKCLMFQNYRLILKMIDEQGWILRNQIIWHKPNCMPQSARDRFTVDFEPVFFLVKNKNYWFEQQFEKATDHFWDNFNLRVRDNGKLKSQQYKASKEEITKYTNHRTYGGGGSSLHNHSGYCKRDGSIIGNPGKRHKRCIWTISTEPFRDAHFATFPQKLIEPMVQAGCPEGGVVLDPFMGSGTTPVVAKKLSRNYIGIELNKKYIKIADERIPNLLF